jgi:hypothetical protein
MACRIEGKDFASLVAKWVKQADFYGKQAEKFYAALDINIPVYYNTSSISRAGRFCGSFTVYILLGVILKKMRVIHPHFSFADTDHFMIILYSSLM